MAESCASGIDTGFATLDVVQAAILGGVQGITELLPISSTAHMRLVPYVMGWADPGSAFSAIMQLAALAAVISYFRRDLSSIATQSVRALQTRDFGHRDVRLLLGMIVATVPIGLAGVALSSTLNACGTVLREPWVIGAASLAMAFLLAAAEILASHHRNVGGSRLRDYVIIGLAQVGALIPGVSRSGSTFTAGMFLGFSREASARLSFLLGLPAITLAGLKELTVLLHAGIDAHAWLILFVGLVTGSLSAFIAIWGLLRFVERLSTWPIIVYRAVMGALILAMVLI
jgi:undecaprenyl-diphosphatase